MTNQDDLNLRLIELGAITFPKTTARELHYPVNHLVRRVQRKEDVRFKTAVEKQREEIIANIQLLDARLLEVEQVNGVLSPEPVVNLWGFPVKTKTRIETKKRLRRIR